MEARIAALLCLVLPGVGAIIVNIPQDTYEFARGDNITLPCTFTTTVTSNEIVIKWSAEALNTAKPMTVLTYYLSKDKTDVRALYKGRASLDVNIAMGKADLKLSSIKIDDNRVFECNVLVPGDDQPTPDDTTTLVVLVAPSTPICNVQGTAEYGQNINLTCASQEGSPPPTYKWISRDVNNMPRVLDPKTTDKGGILSLFNISKDTSGYFICTSTNKIRSASCNLTLSVMPPSMNIGSTAGIVIGVVAVLILLIIIICCCCCRKKKKDEEYAMGVHEEEYHDKEPTVNGENHHPNKQEDIQSHDESTVKSSPDRSEHYKEQSEPQDDRRRDYDDRRSDYDDRRSDYDDRRSDYDDRRRDYDDRRSDYDDRRSDYSDRRDRYSDRHERYDDERRYDDRRDRRHDDDDQREPHDDRKRPPVALKPPKRDDH